jgi:hypothetical protein
MAALFVIDTRQTTPYALADLFRTCPLPTPFFLCAQNDIAGDDLCDSPFVRGSNEELTVPRDG